METTETPIVVPGGPTADATPAPTPDGNPNGQLTGQDFNSDGTLKSTGAALTLVVQSASKAKAFIANKQWTLLWRDADLLYQSPRPMTVYENTYVLEPNVQRFTVAKICNAVVPQLYKGLFYDDPPMLIRPRPGTSQDVIDAKTALFSYILDECGFKTQTKWGLEQMAHLGTAIFKWGYNWKDIVTAKRKATKKDILIGKENGANQTISLTTVDPPDITTTTHTVPMPFIEHRPLDKVLVDPTLSVGDIRHASWVVDVMYVDFYQLKALRDAITSAIEDGERGSAIQGWKWSEVSEESLKTLWNSPGLIKAQTLETEQASYIEGVVHHAEKPNQMAPADPLRTKIEILEYWDKDRKIVVLNQEKVLCETANEFKKIPFLSANWWNRPRAFYGMGLGLIIGQNQRVDQGTINAILKILSFGVNPIYLRNRDDNAPTQVIRTGLGKILSVTDTEKSYRLMETPKVPGDIWSALKENQDASESASGADQMLVQGSSSGPRSSMGRTSGGANILAGASATRLDGPLDNFIEQVFKPFLGVLDWMVFNILSDAAILHILGKEAGEGLTKTLDIQEFHDAQIEYEVLAGSSLAAKRTMAQSMVMLTQILDNPQIQELLAADGKKIRMVPIISMWLEASEWKNKNDIVVDMTPEEKAERKRNSKAALMQQQIQAKQATDSQKFNQKQQLEDQASDNRMKRDVVREAMKATGLNEAVEGEPSPGGLQGQLPTVV